MQQRQVSLHMGLLGSSGQLGGKKVQRGKWVEYGRDGLLPLFPGHRLAAEINLGASQPICLCLLSNNMWGEG